MKLNNIDGKQYPYGFCNWLMRVSFVLIDKHGCFKDEHRVDAWKKLDPDSWLVFFMDGLPPLDAVKMDIKERLR